jgi:hypothetical protein
LLLAGRVNPNVLPDMQQDAAAALEKLLYRKARRGEGPKHIADILAAIGGK